MNRRYFLKTGTLATAALAWGGFPTELLARDEVVRLTILHTNDMHSRIDPFPADDKNFAGKGGMARRARLISDIRAVTPNVLVFDSGDIFQGTPYFNFFGGELEIKLMSRMGYDAATIGNHDFDGGLDNLRRQLGHATFPMLNCNYDFRGTEMESRTLPYKVFVRQGVRIGVTGVGIELQGLVPEQLYGVTRYLDPVQEVQKVADHLRHQEQCDMIICLSHLGFDYKDDKVSDKVLAKNTRNVDVILGGHTHTFMEKPLLVPNLEGKPVIINQVGWAGLVLGRLDFSLEKNRKNKCVRCVNSLIDSV